MCWMVAAFISILNFSLLELLHNIKTRTKVWFYSRVLLGFFRTHPYSALLRIELTPCTLDYLRGIAVLVSV